jgi:hypothetical protein
VVELITAGHSGDLGVKRPAVDSLQAGVVDPEKAS